MKTFRKVAGIILPEEIKELAPAEHIMKNKSPYNIFTFPVLRTFVNRVISIPGKVTAAIERATKKISPVSK